MILSAAEEIVFAAFPPQGILVLGIIEQPRLKSLVDAGARHITLVDPDESRLEKMVRGKEFNEVSINTDIKAVTEDGQSASFYVASLNRESGFVHPESLKPLWKNIEVEERMELDSCTLTQYLEDNGKSFNWLISDRLDVGKVLEGSKDCLPVFDLLVLRSATGLPKDAVIDQADLDKLLMASGFCKIHEAADRHPKLRTAIYMNDWKTRLERQLDTVNSTLENEQNSFAKEKATLNDRIESLHAFFSEENGKLSDQIQKLKETHTEESVLRTERLEQTQARIRELEAELSGSTKALERMTGQFELQNKNRVIAENNLNDLVEKYERLSSQNMQLESMIEDILQEISSAEAKLQVKPAPKRRKAATPNKTASK
ncbi:MAG: hypothetical protein ACX94B_00300 [Henriciella sp.]